MNRFISLLCIEPFSLSFYFSPDYLYSLFLFLFSPDHNWSYHWSHAQARMKPSHWNYYLLFICFLNYLLFAVFCFFLIICYSLVFFLKAEIDLITEIIISYWSANLFFSLGGKLLTWQLHYKAPRNLDNSPKGSSYSVFECVQVSDIWVSNLILFGLRQILLVNVSDVFWHWHSS